VGELDGGETGAEDTSATPTRFCHSCGTKLSDPVGRFCQSCGASVGSSPESAAPESGEPSGLSAQEPALDAEAVPEDAARSVAEAPPAPKPPSAKRSRWWVLAPIAIVAAIAAAVVLLIARSDSSSTSPEDASTTTLPSPSELPPETVAIVTHVPAALGTLTRSELSRAIAESSAGAGGDSQPRPGSAKYEETAESALETLLQSIWIQGESTERGIDVTPVEIAKEREKIKREDFKSEAQYRKFLAESHYTESDVRERVKTQILSQKIQEQLQHQLKHQAEQQGFAKFVTAFDNRWRARTVCLPRYAIKDCSNGPALVGASHSGADEAAPGVGHSASSGACSEGTGGPTGSKRYPCPNLAETLPNRSTATVKTNFGTFTIDLASEEAPLTTTSFAYLAEQGFYNGLTFHRIVPNFVIQGGDPLGTGAGGPGYRVVEKPPKGLHYGRGVVAMAKSSSEPAGSSGSQFFVVTGADAGLPPEYALLGTVGQGMGVVTKISKLPTVGEKPKQRVVMEEVTIVRG
jgi:peptidyl-prolyl cis-trans isomerase B (cyclophilin B)